MSKLSALSQPAAPNRASEESIDDSRVRLPFEPTKPLSLQEQSEIDRLVAATDQDIDFSDIPELDDAFWATAKLVHPEPRQSVTLRVRKSVLDAFKASGRGYQTRMNAVLESYVRSVTKP